MADASPAKWHLGHTSWFFETFALRDFLRGFARFDDRWPFLFNSYYEAEGVRLGRNRRGLLTRPSLGEIFAYRRFVDETVLENIDQLAELCPDLLELGLQHEQQHQELMLTDMKHLFAQNPLGEAPWSNQPAECPRAVAETELSWIEGEPSLSRFGHEGTEFAFDNEGPAHRAYLVRHALANRTITNGEWSDFIEDSGYRTSSLWLSDGWAWIQRENVTAPLYWRDTAHGPEEFTLTGWRPAHRASPVAHISFFEAEAFAAWAGARLPTEFEWEAAGRPCDAMSGNQLDEAGPVQPRPGAGEAALSDLFGNLWEWTGSAYRPYPGFRPAPGAVGEYNGKFMSGQHVLKGGSCATPRGHVRASYRNFFYPHQRWQFTGLRLAKDL